jgi:hypothetical protein
MTGNNWTHTQHKKYNFIMLAAKCGSEVAEKYIGKVGVYGVHASKETYEMFGEKKLKESSVEWAYRVVKKSISRDYKILQAMRNEERKQSVTHTPVFG